MADAGVLSPTEFAKRMLNKEQRKESIKNIKDNIKENLTEIRHEVKDTVKVSLITNKCNTSIQFCNSTNTEYLIVVYKVRNQFIFKHLPDGHRGHLGAVVDRPIPPYKHIKPDQSDQDTPPTTSRSMPKRSATVDHPPTYDSAIGRKK